MSEHMPAAVVNVQPPQNYVTRDAFDATVLPMQGDISEIKGDVKTLLARDAGSRAVYGFISKTGGVAAMVLSGAVGSLLALFIH